MTSSPSFHPTRHAQRIITEKHHTVKFSEGRKIPVKENSSYFGIQLHVILWNVLKTYVQNAQAMRQPQRSTCNPSGLGMVHQRQATSSSETCNRWFREKHDRFSATPNLSNCTLSSISLCGETAQVSKRIRSIKARRQKENPSPPLEDTYMTSAKYLDSLDSLPPLPAFGTDTYTQFFL